MNRLTEPSTYAGLGLLFQGLAGALASKGTDMTALASIMGGIAAIAMREKAKN